VSAQPPHPEPEDQLRALREGDEARARRQAEMTPAERLELLQRLSEQMADLQPARAKR